MNPENFSDAGEAGVLHIPSELSMANETLSRRRLHGPTA